MDETTDCPQPNLLDSLFRIVSEVFLDGNCPYDPHTIPKAEIGAVLTLPRMAQLKCFLYNSVCMAYTRLLHVYSGRALPTPTSLMQSIESMLGWTLLLISSYTATGEACIFGLYFTDPKTYGDRIRDLHSATENTAMLFQLSPIHAMFRVVAGKLAWSVIDDRVLFGEESHGAALSLDGPRLEKACFTYNPSRIDEDTVYRAASPRGAFETRFTIETIELWAQQSDYMAI